MPEALQRYAPDARIGDVSAKQLRAVIAAVTRGAALDGVRAQVVTRAEALHVGGLLPDNWRSDGTLASATATWSTDEQRETWSDLYVGLEAALKEKFDDDDSYYCWVYVQDLTDTEVIFVKSGEVFSAPYTVTEGGPIEIGDPVKVRPVTEYVKTSSTEELAAGPLREWRKAKVRDLKGLERRTFAVRAMELREQDDGTLHLSGYASVTGVAYDVGWYEETIERGAFKRTLGESPDVQLLINHTGMPLARTSSGTLTLCEDDRGLKVEADLDPEDPDVQSLARKMKRGDIDQMSFAFQATASDWNEDYTARTITAVSIHRGDVSVVNQGANPAAAASIRSHDALAALRRGGTEQTARDMIALGEYRARPVKQRGTLDPSAMEMVARLAQLLTDTDEEARAFVTELVDAPPPAPAADPAPVVRAALPNHTKRARERLAAHRAGSPR